MLGISNARRISVFFVGCVRLRLTLPPAGRRIPVYFVRCVRKDAFAAEICVAGDHQQPRKPGGGPSAAKLALASFLFVVALFALDAYLTGAGADRRQSNQYQHYLGGDGGGRAESESASLSWLSVPSPTNFTEDLLARWLTPGGSRCRDARTANISVPVLDGAAAAGRVTTLSATEIHEFRFWALDDTGLRHCLGGDFFEIDLSGEAWKSRPPVVDNGDGSYTFRLQVAPRFAAEEFRLTIVLLFRNLASSPPLCSTTSIRTLPDAKNTPLEILNANGRDFILPDANVSRPDANGQKKGRFLRLFTSGR